MSYIKFIKYFFRLIIILFINQILSITSKTFFDLLNIDIYFETTENINVDT